MQLRDLMWQIFKATGGIDAYLAYRQSLLMKEEEDEDLLEERGLLWWDYTELEQ